jgi:butyrate kinase
MRGFMMTIYKILVLNLGSTSTKLRYCENDRCIIIGELRHKAADLAVYPAVWDQLEYRKKCITDFFEEKQIALDDLDAVVTRGGHTKPLVGGTYRINKLMLEQSRSGVYGVHATDLGLVIAVELAGRSGKGAVPLTVDPPTTDEFEPLARYSGLPELPRRSSFHALNQRAVGRQYARDIGRSYDDMNLVVVHMGGGITVAAHKKGKMVDANNGLAGDGPFSTDRCGGLPSGALVELCFSGKYTKDEIRGKLNGRGGMMAYLGTNDVQDTEHKALTGDALCSEVLEALAYQTAKEIASCAAVLCGDVDAVILTGGMAKSAFLTGLISERVGFIAPVRIYPGEYEMQSLMWGAYEALAGIRPILELD